MPLFCGVLIRSESVNNMKPDYVMYLAFFPSCVAKMAVTFVLRKGLFGFGAQWLIISSLSYQIADFVKKNKKNKKQRQNKGRKVLSSINNLQ